MVKCNHLTALPFKGLTDDLSLWPALCRRDVGVQFTAGRFERTIVCW